MLREKCPNTELFLVRICTLFTQWMLLKLYQKNFLFDIYESCYLKKETDKVNEIGKFRKYLPHSWKVCQAFVLSMEVFHWLQISLLWKVFVTLTSEKFQLKCPEFQGIWKWRTIAFNLRSFYCIINNVSNISVISF